MDQLLSIEPLHQDGCVIVALRGELDVAGEPKVKELASYLSCRYDASQVTLECTRLTFIDSAGIMALLQLSRVFGSAERVTLRNPHGQVRRVLELSGASPWFRIEDVAHV